MQLEIGKKALITTDGWFFGHDGKEYRAVYGTVHAVRDSTEVLGVKTNARSTNWYVEIGRVTLAGCQIHYAINADGLDVHTGDAQHWTVHDGQTKLSDTPSKIYCAD